MFWHQSQGASDHVIKGAPKHLQPTPCNNTLMGICPRAEPLWHPQLRFRNFRSMSLVLIVLLVALMIPLTAVILDSQVGRAIAARLEKGKDPVEGGSRIAALEAEVDRLGKEVSRLDEETAFLHKLLETRSHPPEVLPPGADAS